MSLTSLQLIFCRDTLPARFLQCSLDKNLFAPSNLRPTSGLTEHQARSGKRFLRLIKNILSFKGLFASACRIRICRGKRCVGNRQPFDDRSLLLLSCLSPSSNLCHFKAHGDLIAFDSSNELLGSFRLEFAFDGSSASCLKRAITLLVAAFRCGPQCGNTRCVVLDFSNTSAKNFIR